MIKKIEGIVVSETAYGDTSKIINVFTKEYGIIGVIAKGAKGIKSKLRNVSSIYTYGFFHVYYKEDKLSTLIEGDIINNFDNIKADIILFGYLSYIVELATQVYKQNDDEEIYRLLISTLKKINDGLDPKIMTNIIEIKLLDYLGISLNLNGCATCGNNTNIVTINGDIGGYICGNCHKNEPIYDVKTIKMLRMYYYVEIDSVTSLDISEKVVRDIDHFLNIYYDKYTGLYLHTKKFLKDLIEKIK